MPTYKYEALSPGGAKVSGVVDAFDEMDAVVRIKENCSVVTSVKEVRGKGLSTIFAPRTTEKALSLVCTQFAIILGAGLPIVRCVELTASQTADKVLRKLLTEVAADVFAGHSLADSFEMRGSFLPPTFIETIRAGEESGQLETSFRRLGTYFENRSKTKGKVYSALIYPGFVICVGIVVVAVIMIYAVPVFSSTFASMGSDMPGITRLLINLSEFMVKYILVIVAVLAALIIGIKLYSHSAKGRMKFGRLALRLPAVGKVNLMNGASQFANTMSTMLSSGLPIANAITATGRSLSNAALSEQVLDMVAGVESGRPLGACMRDSSLFPPLLVEMTAVGEETGSMESTLEVIGDYFDNEVSVAVARMLSLLEPILILVLAVFVVGILMAVYLPIFSMYGGVG